MSRQTANRTRKLPTMAMLAAISIVLVALIHFPIIPGATFLEYDPADVSILVGTFLFGPWAGLALTAVVSVIQGLTVSAGSGVIGIDVYKRQPLPHHPRYSGYPGRFRPDAQPFQVRRQAAQGWCFEVIKTFFAMCRRFYKCLSLAAREFCRFRVPVNSLI